MARVRFTRDFDYQPEGTFGVTIAYRGGQEYTVKREAADAAVKARAASEIDPPARGKSDGAEA